MLSIRKIAATGLTYSHLTRYRQILSVFFKYGFEDILNIISIDKYVDYCMSRISRKRWKRLDRYSRFERLRMALEELGPSFIKLGQAISMRPDLVPVGLIRELAKLQDMVPPCPFAEIEKIITAEFCLPIPDMFAYFDEIPLASASIGQVYKARLRDGTEVAVKVQRPGLKRLVAVDIGIMYHLAGLIERNIEEVVFIRPIKIVEEFARTLARELDYSIEAANMERFAKSFEEDPTIHIPRVYHRFTSKRVLTMEFIYGIKVSDIGRLERAGIEKKLITRRGADILLKQTFEHGFFHSDPHSGNIFIMPNNVIAMLDFGQVGTVDQQSKEDFVDLIDNVVRQNQVRATRQLLRITFWDKKPDVRQLEKDVANFMGKHLYKTLKDLEIGVLVQDLLEMVSRHRLRIPPDIFLMMKALATIEGIGRQLDPDFDMIEHATPFIRQVKLDRMNPQRVSEDIIGLSVELLQFLKQFPTDMMELSRMIRDQKLALKMDPESIESILSAQYRMGNRISLSIIIAAIVVGSALVVFAKLPPLYHGISSIGLAGFVVAAVLGIGLLLGIFRKGRL